MDVLAFPNAPAGIVQDWDALDAALPVRTPFTSPMSVLCVNGEVLALRLGFTYGHEPYLHCSTHDPAWRRYGAGIPVDTAAVEWAAGQGMARVNLSTRSDLSKTRRRQAATA